MRFALVLGTVSILGSLAVAQQDNSSVVVQAIIAANNNNRTALHEIRAPTWVSAPDVRGTLSIVWSCVVTIVACVYTALHLNIPKKNGVWTVLLHKIKWVAIALVAPELLLYIASSQFFEACSLQKRMKGLIRERGNRETDPDEVSWRQTYLSMGISTTFLIIF